MMCTQSGGSRDPPGVPTISSGVFCDGNLPAITRTPDGPEEGEPSGQPRSGRSSGWKTSKFFSRTMSSGELLRGLKKLSLSGPDPGDAAADRPRKSKSGPLKKRSSCGNEEGVEEERQRSPGSFRPLSKAMSLSEPGSASKTTHLGIVCKKEDLKAILGSSRRFPLSPPKRRLRQTKSASFEPQAKEPVRRSGSEEEGAARSEAEGTTRGTHEEDRTQQPPTPQVSCPAEVTVDRPNVVRCESDPPGSLSAVKWDECEVVDAVLLGGAIESFLKGAMTGPEKRVSFRRHCDRKVKSDG